MTLQTVRRMVPLAAALALPYIALKSYWAAGCRAGLADGYQLEDDFTRNGAPTPLVWLEHHGIDFTAVLALTGVAIALTVALHPPVSRLPRRLLLVPAWAGAPLIVYGLLTALLAPFDHSPGAGPITGWIVPAGAAAFVGIGTALTLGAWPHRASRPTATARRSPGMPG